jgi:hypothetical protein
VFSEKICPEGLALRTFFDQHVVYSPQYVMDIKMERIEQRVMVKYFFLKRHGSKLIHKELASTLQDNAISLSTITNRLKRFKSADLSCGDEERSRRPLISLDPALQHFQKKSPFASARAMPRYLS